VDEYCGCDHRASDHVDGTGRCRRRNDEGDKCGCPAFEDEPENDRDDD
jgi:hypothetical protein